MLWSEVKLTSDEVLGHLNSSMQSFPVESGAVPVAGSDEASQYALHSATVELFFFFTQTEFLHSPEEEAGGPSSLLTMCE